MLKPLLKGPAFLPAYRGKAMFKFLWMRRKAVTPVARDWRYDPMGHPALREMSLRELADLPMVAEVPTRMARVEVTEDCQRRVSRVQSARCAISR